MESRNIPADIYEFLTNFGLTDKEIRIYLSLLSIGPSTIMNISRQTGIKRSTTHNNVEELIKKGLISQTTYGERRMVIAEEPEKLKHLLEQYKWKVKKLEDGLDNATGQIVKQFSNVKAKDLFQVRYYQGIEGFRDVCNRSLEAANGEIMFISNHERWRKVFTEEYDNKVYVPNRVEKGIKMKSLVMQGVQGKRLKANDKDKLRETRYLPKSFKIPSTVIIYRSEVSIMISKEPYVAINIQGKEIYQTFKTIFKNLWEQVETK